MLAPWDRWEHLGYRTCYFLKVIWLIRGKIRYQFTSGYHSIIYSIIIVCCFYVWTNMKKMQLWTFLHIYSSEHLGKGFLRVVSNNDVKHSDNLFLLLFVICNIWNPYLLCEIHLYFHDLLLFMFFNCRCNTVLLWALYFRILRSWVWEYIPTVRICFI